MATVNSSLIGANLASSDSTALFALGTTVDTTDGGLYQYVQATSTLNTGQWCVISSVGSAYLGQTARLTANAEGIMLAWAQGLINQSEYGWVATRGRNLYIMCTGTCTAGSELGFGFSANSGRLQSIAAVGAANTVLGVFITTSASTATQSVAVGTLSWPRAVTMGS
jgi:hypothetical protein